LQIGILIYTVTPMRSPRRRLAALSLLPLALVVAACGDDDSSSSGGSSGSGGSGGGFTLQVADPGNAGPVAYGKREGLFDDALAEVGASIEWVETTPGFSSNLPLFQSGELDISGGAYSPVVGALSRDVPVRIFAVADPVGKDQNGIVAAEGSGIETIDDLAGHRVAVNPRAKGEYLLLRALTLNDIPVDEVERVPLQQAEAASAFSTGQVDAWASFGPPYQEAKANGAVELVTEADLDSDDYTIIASRTEVLEDHPEVVQAYLETVQELTEQQREHPEDFENVFEEAGPRALSGQRLEDAVDLGREAAVPRYPTAEDATHLESVAQLFADNGVIPAAVVADDVFFDLPEALGERGSAAGAAGT
jgi:sulfonate transport system substrate-binding protein